MLCSKTKTHINASKANIPMTLKPEIKYGLFMGLGVSLWVILEFLLGFHTTRMEIGRWSGYFSVIIPILCLYFGIQETKAETYWQKVKAGVVMVSIAAVIIALFFVIYNLFINPGWIEQGVVLETQRLAESGVTEEEILAAEQTMRWMFSIEMQVVGAFLGTLIEGCILTLLIAALVKRKED